MSTTFHLFTALLFCILSTSAIQAQNFVFVDDDIPDATMTVRIANKVTFPDIKVVLARDIPFEDFSVGITPFKRQANYIITKEAADAQRLVKVDNCDNFPDLSILVQEKIPFPDVRIEFRDNNAFVDILIYTEKTTVSEQEIIACLLPLIREKAQK
ncbi:MULTISPECIES: hypothetical protein [unclassified Aureispira]|uniref:hypothetical protein n=1 Tax=unclassified Aureispira TaxID=2649989 RepID=UPI000696FE8E|nr:MULTISPECIES: hypothetical protein [unclassified Aureispira]WMX15938.1 hypothetical protein QP953_06125 [Aureispira sp. CCB-E]